jgi:hypothetical protein
VNYIRKKLYNLCPSVRLSSNTKGAAEGRSFSRQKSAKERRSRS